MSRIDDMAEGVSEINRLRAEVERLRAGEAFRAVTVQQRNEAWARIDCLQAEVERLKRALAGAVPWIGEHAEGPAWASDEAKRENRQMCEAAFDAACNALQPLPDPPKEEE